MTLRMTQQGDMRMTGLFTTNSGEMKYQLPVIPLKTFQIVQGSYVQFTGDVMNPTLNIAAKERTKAVVTEDDKQRSVAFDVGVKITKPLNDMGLEFTIEAPEDLNIQNQLASMSAEQRGKAAVTMMATGMYMTDETMMSGSGFKALIADKDKEYARSVVQKSLSKQFAPEFLNRFDEIITFDQLDIQAIKRIVDLELKTLVKRVEEKGYHFQITEKAKEFVATKGYDVQFGARPLKRAIQNYVEDGLCSLLMEGNLLPGDTITIGKSTKKDELTFKSNRK